jgi:serine/threonine-protein kinase RsbT
VADEISWEIAVDLDVVQARQSAREQAGLAGFSAGDQTVIAAAVSEIARNILMYARRGTVTLRLEEEEERRGLIIIARDEGPGITDVPRAMQDGFSTSGGLGVGLPGSRRLMDEFEVTSQPGRGTTVTMKEWKRNA